MESWNVILLLAWLWVGNELEGANFNDTRASRSLGSKTTTCPCGASNKGRVVGGYRAMPNEYPWVASLVRNKDSVHVCAATIITESIAITAAHCIVNKEPTSLRVGTSDISKPGALIPLKGYSSYNWNPGRTGGLNDISLIYMARPITFSAAVRWGRLGFQRPGSKNLMEADVQVIPFNVCKMYHKSLQLPVTQLCFRTPGKGGCFGDSGGPVVWLDPETNRYTLLGLVSFGSPKCDTKIPTVNTDVSAFIPWIRSTIQSKFKK
ncbi:unnamed protein product [Nezara viridula]|uniref:Peptidase S1 domain-containing protein n=1 Tax=Nezara viridula TaxID=85310 RepID=A0A9P0HG05_NEZVI|nr:unnamed protein product [Nezara viridula]